jgi:hypothetical protein
MRTRDDLADGSGSSEISIRRIGGMCEWRGGERLNTESAEEERRGHREGKEVRTMVKANYGSVEIDTGRGFRTLYKGVKFDRELPEETGGDV